MTQERIQALERELALKQRELDMVMNIDHIRDSFPDPAAMLSAIVTHLADVFRADLCALALINRETQQVELKAMKDRKQHQFYIDRTVAEKAVHLDTVTLWTEQDLALKDVPSPLYIAAVPIIMGNDERLGALLLTQSSQPFNGDDVKLLKTAESMVDSAIIQGYAHYELKQHVRELAAIYRIDQIRDQGLPFDEMLNVVLNEICEAIDVEAGFTMLYDQAGEQLELRASTQHDLFQTVSLRNVLDQLAHEALAQGKLLCRDNVGDGLRSIMTLPLILKGQVIGVLGVINHCRHENFTHDDRRLLTAIGSQIDTAIFENMERQHMRSVLERSVDPQIMERLLASRDVSFLKGERMYLSVLYADLRGSTSLAERTAPDTLVEFINHYLGAMTEVILDNEGTLDKFVGDEVMALFGAPFTQPDHALRAVQVALKMQQAHQAVMRIWEDRGMKPAPMGVGIATGELIVGEMGGPQRTDFTVIGKAANLGSRICSSAQAGEVLICPETYQLIRDQVEVTLVEGLQFKGVQRDVVVYRIEHVLA